MKFEEMNLQFKEEKAQIQIDDSIQLDVRSYLPLVDKIALLNYVVDHALDENSGRFSPVRIELFFTLAVVHWYAGIVFEDDVKALDAYDKLEINGVVDKIIGAIPQEEYKFLSELVEATTKDIADYNSSFVGILQMANREAGGLDKQLTEILGKVKNREGLELLDQIKNVVGTD